MSVLQLGHRAKSCHFQAQRDFRAMSALPPKADIVGRDGDVRFVPEPDMALPHSITSSAIERMPGGAVSPRVFAVFKLSTNSNLVGCITGKVDAFSPRRIRPV